MTGGAPESVATPAAVGFENDPDRTVRENVERTLAALTAHIDDLTTEQVENVVFRYATGSGPARARHVLREGTVDLGSEP